MNTSKLVNICIIVKKLIKVFADKLTESQQEPDDVVGFTTTAQQLAMLNTSEIPTESSGVNISETWASSSTVSCCCLHRWPLYVTAIITSYDSSNHSSDPCHLMSRGCWFRHSFHIIFTSCNFMPCKCLENWSVNFMSCNFMSCTFDGPSFSCPAFSVNPSLTPWDEQSLMQHLPAAITKWMGLVEMLALIHIQKMAQFCMSMYRQIWNDTNKMHNVLVCSQQ